MAPPDPAGAARRPGEALLAPELLAQLERLQVRTRRRLAGRFGGEHRSPLHGASLDFADLRAYVPGDDVRRIDHQAWARLDQLLVRLYEATDDLHLRILVDTSRSMAGAKLHQARRLAAALGFVALVARDSVSLHTFPLDQPARRFRGRAAAPAFFDVLARLDASGATPFADATRHFLSRPGPPGLTLVLSDLLTPEWERGITRLPARGGDLAVGHVLAAEELRPQLAGDLELVDAETGATVAVSLSDATRRDYERMAVSWADDVAARCGQIGAAYVRVLDTDDVASLLLGGWRSAGVLR